MADKIIVYDLECCCWMGKPPEGMCHEIIEFGYCIFDPSTKEISDKRSIIVKPTRSEINWFCTKITGLTNKIVHAPANMFFKGSYCALMEDIGHHGPMVAAAWGKSDKKILEMECKRHKVKYPFEAGHLDVQTLFSSEMEQKNGTSVAKAMDQLGLSFEGQQHRAGDDAYNTAVILSRIYRDSPKKR